VQLLLGDDRREEVDGRAGFIPMPSVLIEVRRD